MRLLNIPGTAIYLPLLGIALDFPPAQFITPSSLTDQPLFRVKTPILRYYCVDQTRTD